MTIAVYDNEKGVQFTAALDFYSQYLAAVMYNGAPRYKNLGEVTPPPAPQQTAFITPKSGCKPCGK